MNLLCAVLTAVAAGALARRRHASFVVWGVLAAISFFTIDSLLSARLVGRFVDTFASDEGAFLGLVVLKCALAGIVLLGVSLASRYTRTGRGTER